jgi:opacity protein-like surface antigen
MKIQIFASIISISLALGAVSQAQGSDREDAARANGFYGGVSYRDNTPAGLGVNFGAGGVALNRQPATVVDDSATRALVFGGYRWHNDVAVEASVSSLDQYALRPLDTLAAQRGVGLKFGAATGDLQNRVWNVDLFTSWTVYKAVALYGRLGYAQSEAPLPPAPATGSIAGIRGLRDGMNYGVGVRYDMNSALGLKLEYSRFGRFAGEFGNGLPDSDQVTLGVRLRF